MKKMKKRNNKAATRGLTVIELSLTLALMLAFASITISSVGGIKNWKLARMAGEEVRAVYLAQKSYLADHPTVKIVDISAADLLPYLPGGRTAIPTVQSLEGEALPINIHVIPPVITAAGGNYDPSGSTSDSLWDAGTQ